METRVMATEISTVTGTAPASTVANAAAQDQVKAKARDAKARKARKVKPMAGSNWDVRIAEIDSLLATAEVKAAAAVRAVHGTSTVPSNYGVLAPLLVRIDALAKAMHDSVPGAICGGCNTDGRIRGVDVFGASFGLKSEVREQDKALLAKVKAGIANYRAGI